MQEQQVLQRSIVEAVSCVMIPELVLLITTLNMYKYAFSFYLFHVCQIISAVKDVVAVLVTDRGLRSSGAQAK